MQAAVFKLKNSKLLL